MKLRHLIVMMILAASLLLSQLSNIDKSHLIHEQSEAMRNLVQADAGLQASQERLARADAALKQRCFPLAIQPE